MSWEDLLDMYEGPSYPTQGGGGAFVACMVLAIIGAVALMATYLAKKNEHKFTGFLDYLYDFLNFKKLLLDVLLRFMYLALALYCTLFSFVLLFTGQVGGFFGLLLLGNLTVRVAYELVMLLLIIARNVSEINKKSLNAAELPPIPSVLKKEPAPPQNGAFCAKCGKPLADGAAFCNACGAPLQ